MLLPKAVAGLASMRPRRAAGVRPLAYGYVRLGSAAADQAKRLVHEMTTYAHRGGRTLADVISDRVAS